MSNVQGQFAERQRTNGVKEKMEREAEFKGREMLSGGARGADYRADRRKEANQGRGEEGGEIMRDCVEQG